MKIAICISGQIRENFSEFIEKLEKFVINNYNCDIFLCTDSIYKEKLTNKDIFTDIKFIDFNDDLYKKYKLASLSMGYASYFYKIHKCNKLLQKYKKHNNVDYDLVLHLRPDLIINEKINFRKIDKNTIYGPWPRNKIMNLINSINIINKLCIISDQVFYGNYNTMKKLCNFYKNTIIPDKYIYINNPEILLNYFLKKNINFEKIYDFDYNYIYKNIKKFINQAVLYELFNIIKFYLQIIFKCYFKVLCCQIALIILLTLLYCKFYNYYDILIYFIFGAFISIYLNASIILIKKYKICTSIEFTKKYINDIFKLYKKYTNFNEENICKIMYIFGIIIHLLFPLVVLYYVKDYIKNSIKTEYAYVKAFIIFIIYVLINIYIIGSFKVYNKSLELTKTHFNIIITSIILTYIALLYYFESIKNRINYL
jgi:hypothetical protein